MNLDVRNEYFYLVESGPSKDAMCELQQRNVTQRLSIGCAYVSSALSALPPTFGDTWMRNNQKEVYARVLRLKRSSGRKHNENNKL